MFTMLALQYWKAVVAMLYIPVMGYVVLSDNQIYRDRSGVLWRPVPKLARSHAVLDRYAAGFVFMAACLYLNVLIQLGRNATRYLAKRPVGCFCILLITAEMRSRQDVARNLHTTQLQLASMQSTMSRLPESFEAVFNVLDEQGSRSNSSNGNALMESIRTTGRWARVPGGKTQFICKCPKEKAKTPSFFCNFTSPGVPKIYTALHAKRFDAHHFADISAKQKILCV
jgi:hypothetical protein